MTMELRGPLDATTQFGICGSCGRDIDWTGEFPVPRAGATVYELSVGSARHRTVIRFCPACLGELALRIDWVIESTKEARRGDTLSH